MYNECKNKHLHSTVRPPIISCDTSISDLVEQCMGAYNSRQLSDACKLYSRFAGSANVRIGLSLSGALTPAGIGISCIVPMMKDGLVDWIVSTGANLYHDIHYVLGYDMYRGSHVADDAELYKDGVVRIYDLFFNVDALYKTDQFIRKTVRKLVGSGLLKGKISSSELHYFLGKEIIETNPESTNYSVLAAAAQLEIPIHTSSPGDSSIGLNLAALNMEGVDIYIDPSQDVNETASYVYDAKLNGKKSAVVLLGGGSPKNFVLQTEPHIQEVLGLEESGHDYFIQITDARPDTGGLSGATPSEAVSWGKIDPDQISNTIVCYGDCTVYLPIMVRYLLEKVENREQQKLYSKKRKLLESLRNDYLLKQS